jgi:hypothetical protein
VVGKVAPEWTQTYNPAGYSRCSPVSYSGTEGRGELGPPTSNRRCRRRRRSAGGGPVPSRSVRESRGNPQPLAGFQTCRVAGFQPASDPQLSPCDPPANTPVWKPATPRTWTSAPCTDQLGMQRRCRRATLDDSKGPRHSVPASTAAGTAGAAYDECITPASSSATTATAAYRVHRGATPCLGGAGRSGRTARSQPHRNGHPELQ